MTKTRGFCGFSRALLLASSLLLSSPLSCYSLEGAPQTQSETLTTLSTQIHEQLENLRKQSKSLTQQLLQAQTELETQSLLADELRTELNELNISLTSTSKKLADYETKLTAYEQKLKAQKRLLRIGLLLVVLFLAVRAVTLALRAKGIKLPDIVNILL